MKKKIIAIGVIGMFLLTGLASISAMGMKASLSVQSLYNKNNVVDEDDGDLWCLEPNIDKIGYGLFNCQVRFINKHEDFTVPGGWEAKVIWHGDPEKEIGHGTYMNDVPPGEYRDDFDIEIKPEEGGTHMRNALFSIPFPPRFIGCDNVYRFFPSIFSTLKLSRKYDCAISGINVVLGSGPANQSEL